MRSIVLVPLCLLLIVPTASSAPVGVILVEDPTGDAKAAGAAQSPTHDWADLVKAELEEVDEGSFTLRLFVAKTGPIHIDGVVTLNFLVGDQWYFMGYGALVFPGGRYEGGFFCPSDEHGNPTGECPNLPASYEDGVFTVPEVPRALFGLDAPGAVLERPWIESGNHVLATHWLQADRSEEGLPYAFQRDLVAGRQPPHSEDPRVASADAGLVGADEPRGGPVVAGESPAPLVGFVFLVWAATAALRRRPSA